MKKLLFLLLVFLPVLSVPAAAAETPEIGELIGSYMAGHGLNGDNFSMGWYDLTSGASYYVGADVYRPGGSMYKLPLNMAVLDALDEGRLTPDTVTDGYTVEQAMLFSIVYSDNDAAQALRHALSDDRDEYRNMLARYADIPELPEGYYTDNELSPRFMIETLRYLYEHSSEYSVLIENLKQAHPGRYFQKNNSDYPIAHKYGYFDGMLNDCAIVYTPEPFLLTVFLHNVPDGETRLSELCALLTEYTLSLDRTVPSAAPEDAVSSAPISSEVPDAAASTGDSVPASPGSPMIGIAGITGLFLLFLLLKRPWKGARS